MFTAATNYTFVSCTLTIWCTYFGVNFYIFAFASRALRLRHLFRVNQNKLKWFKEMRGSRSKLVLSSMRSKRSTSAAGFGHSQSQNASQTGSQGVVSFGGTDDYDIFAGPPVDGVVATGLVPVVESDVHGAITPIAAAPSIAQSAPAGTAVPGAAVPPVSEENRWDDMASWEERWRGNLLALLLIVCAIWCTVVTCLSPAYSVDSTFCFEVGWEMYPFYVVMAVWCFVGCPFLVWILWRSDDTYGIKRDLAITGIATPVSSIM